MKKLLLFSFALLLIAGCASVPYEVNRFDALTDSLYARKVVKDDEEYLAYEAQDFDLSVVLFEYNNIIVMPLSIKNKTGHTIMPDEYSLSLYDGRDHKPIKLFSRDDLARIKAKMEGDASGLPLESQAVELAVSAIASVIQPSEKSAIMKGLGAAIADYFQFRPIWPDETREGILCFIVNFKLEYPIILKAKIKDKQFEIKFMPRPKED